MNNLAAIQPGPPPEIIRSAQVTLQICAMTQNLEIAGDFVRTAAKTAGFDEAGARLIELALDEIVSNAIMHGYSVNCPGKIVIKAAVFDEGLIITTQESGKDFNPFSVEDPRLDVPLTERKIGGLGIYIVKQIMDEIYFEMREDKLKIFSMIKRLNSNTGVSDAECQNNSQA